MLSVLSAVVDFLWDFFSLIVGASLGFVVAGIMRSGKIEDLYCELDKSKAEILRLRRELDLKTYYPPLKVHAAE